MTTSANPPFGSPLPVDTSPRTGHGSDDLWTVARVPSNIAFLKYWGKNDEASQWPANDSLSMTLDKALTATKARIASKGAKLGTAPSDSLTIGGLPLDPQVDRHHKGFVHLGRLRHLTGFSEPLQIETFNTFPSDCGIASSASGLGALTLAALGAWTGAVSLEDLESKGFCRNRLASLARLGSGSACRSLWGGFVAWEASAHQNTQRVYPVAIDKRFQLADLIVVLSKAHKSVSSTGGHRSAWSSPLFAPRLAIHSQRYRHMHLALERQDLDQIGTIIEQEALEMHSVMMTAQPPALYWTDETSRLIAWIRAERLAGRLPAWFTIDAGPNVHVICALQDRAFVESKLLDRYRNLTNNLVNKSDSVEILSDQTGSGPFLGVE